MRLHVAYSVIFFLLVADELRSFVAKGHSDDLGRALGVVRRRRRWLEAGLPLTFDTNRHQYGTVTHFEPTARKRQFPAGDEETFIGNSHVPPEVVWRSLHPHFRERDMDASDEEKMKKMRMKMKMKKSAFREREQVLEEEEKHRKRKKNSMEEGMKTLAERRFLEALLDEGSEEQMPTNNDNFDSSSEVLRDLSPEEVNALIGLLRQREPLMTGRFMEGEASLPDIEERKRTSRKRLMWQDGFRHALGDHPVKKRIGRGEWEEVPQEPSMHSRDRWWDEVDPRLLAALADAESENEEEMEHNLPLEMLQSARNDEDEYEEDDDRFKKIKREQDPWFPAYEIRKRLYGSSAWNDYPVTDAGRLEQKRYFLPVKRKRSSFRERESHTTGGSSLVGTSKRSLPIKRAVRDLDKVEDKSAVKKNGGGAVREQQPKVMEELKTIMADDEKAVKKTSTKKKREDNSEEDDSSGPNNTTHDTKIDDSHPFDEDAFSDEDFSDESLNEYFGDDSRGSKDYVKRDVSQRRQKRSWDQYFGFDKRSQIKKRVSNHIAENHPNLLEEPQVEEKKRPAAKKDEKAAETPAVSHAPETIRPTETASQNASTLPSTTASPEEHKEESGELNKWMMSRYFKSMASAMSSKKKRTVSTDEHDDEQQQPDEGDAGSGEHPLSAMDRKLEAIENLMLEEALELVEGNGAGDGSDSGGQREKILHRLDAAHSLEKMREALAEFEGSLGQIHEDQVPREEDDDQQRANQEEEEKEKRRKKRPVKKQNLAEALHVMAPQTTKRTVNSEESEEYAGGECPIFTEIVALCQELSRSAGDSQRALIGACSRHVMCYACDYAYEEGSQIPCDLIFMREAHDICGDNIYCQSAAAQVHGALRQRAPEIQRTSPPICLSQSCIRAYRRR